MLQSPGWSFIGPAPWLRVLDYHGGQNGRESGERQTGTHPTNQKHIASWASGQTDQRVSCVGQQPTGRERGYLGCVYEVPPHLIIIHLCGCECSKRDTWQMDKTQLPAEVHTDNRKREVMKLTSTPLLSISAASSYSGFIFLQCPHPEGFKTNIRARAKDKLLISKSQ